MDLLTQVFFDGTTNWVSYVLGEFFVDILLVVVDRYLCRLQMANVPKHIDGVLHGHEEVVQLVQLSFVSNHVIHQHWEEFTLPVEETDSSGLLYICLPVRYEVKLGVPVVNFL